MLAHLELLAQSPDLSRAPPPLAHAADRDCGDFDNQRDAQNYFIARGGPDSDPDRLDADGDGRVCVISPR